MNKNYNHIKLFLLFCWSLAHAGNQGLGKPTTDQSVFGAIGQAIDLFEDQGFFPVAVPVNAAFAIDFEEVNEIAQPEDAGLSYTVASRQVVGVDGPSLTLCKRSRTFFEDTNGANVFEPKVIDDDGASISRTMNGILGCRFEGCGAFFINKSNLHRHIKSVHEGKRFICTFDGCSKVFNYSIGLKRHVESVHEGKRFICNFAHCGKSFTESSNLNTHIKSAHDGKRFICTIDDCGKVFKSPNGLKGHVKAIHEGIRFNCPEEGCGKLFKFAVGLKRHIRRHKVGQLNDTSALEQQPDSLPPSDVQEELDY